MAELAPKRFTFFATTPRQIASIAPLYRAAEARGAEVTLATDPSAPAEIGVYCLPAPAVPAVNARLAAIMLEDPGHGRAAWPSLWCEQPWDRFDVGLLPGPAWAAMYAADLGRHRPRSPRYGMFASGWPLADAWHAAADAVPPQTARPRVLYAPKQAALYEQVAVVDALLAAELDVVLLSGQIGHADPPGVHRIRATDLPEALPTVGLVVADAPGLLIEGLVLGLPGLAVPVDGRGDDTTPAPVPVGLDFIETVAVADLPAAARARLAEGRRIQPPLRDAWFAQLGRAADHTLDLLASLAPTDAYVPVHRRVAGGDARALWQRQLAPHGGLVELFAATDRPGRELLGLAFDEAHYLATHPDVREAVSQGYFDTGLAHWQHLGRAEGRAYRVVEAGEEAPPVPVAAPAAAASPLPTGVPGPRRGGRPLVVWSYQKRSNSGGNIALHKLCHLLRARGEDAYLYLAECEPGPEHLFGQFDTPLANGAVDPGEAIVIYPEVVDGNPIGGRHVVRWLLNAPGVVAGTGAYGPDDLYAHYAPRFADEADPAHQLTVIERFASAFSPPATPVARAGGCFVLRKGADKPPIPETAGMRELDNPTPGECAAIFRQHEIFYSYDSATFLSVQAALCGCLSVVVPDPGVSRAAWRQRLPMMRYGIAYGSDDLAWSASTRHLVDGHLGLIEQESELHVEALLGRLAPWR